MSDNLKCLRCGSEMEIIRNQILRIGEPEIPMLRRVPDGIEVDVHDKDYPKCPYCKHDYGRK